MSDAEPALAPMRGCLFGLVAASALWALVGLLVLAVYELGLLALAALVLAACGGAGLLAGTAVASRRLRRANAPRRLDLDA